jgi:hypothetical protein
MKTVPVMLSPFALFRTVLSEAKELRVNSAKHLLFPIANKSRILRAARDDIVGSFFIGLLPT